MKKDDLFLGSLIHPSDQSQQKDAIPASLIRRMTLRSHSFRALSPTNTKCSVPGKLAANMSAADSLSSRSASDLYTMPS